jgi:WS/DGAT/MGAT family acyltransferase
MSHSEFTAEVLEELRNWGGPAEMSAFESVMWRAEIEPRLRSTTTSVFFLDQEPDWERLYNGHQWLVRAVPRFRQHVVEPAFGVGMPTWVIDRNFNLDYHLRHVRLPAPGSERQLLDFAQTLAMQQFDKSRPPWEATLIGGLEGGRAAYVLKMHHAASDGMGIIQLLTRTLSRSRKPSLRPVPKADARERGVRSGSQLARERLLDLPKATAGKMSTLLGSIGRLAQQPDAARKFIDYTDSAKRMLGIKPVAGSPLLKRRSLSWRFDAIEIPLDDFKAAARVCEGSVNDVFLAGLIGGFRRYHEIMGLPIAQMPIGFPISLRTADDTPGGNKFAGSQYAAPVSELDPIARVRHVQAFVRDTRNEPALDIMVRLMPLVVRMPMSAVTKLTLDFTGAQDAQISNIPGINHPVYMAGAEVTHFWPFAPVPGCGMMITMMSHNGRCCIGINSDRAAVIEPELMTSCLREGLQEMLALAKPAGADIKVAPKRSRAAKTGKAST